MVLNASGSGMAAVVRMAGIVASPVPLLSGLNLVLKRPLVAGHALGSLSGGRFLFAVPWRDRGLLGTAYGSPDPAQPREQAEAFLREAARAFPWARLAPADVTAVHHGFVPGGPSGLRSRPILLDHLTDHGVAGLVSIQGVKYTGSRRVAQHAVDRVCARLGRPTASCRTAVTVLAAASSLPGSLEEQTRRAVREEMALHLDDAVLRRLDLGTAGPAEPAEVAIVARVMAEELGWNPERRGAEEDALARALPYAAIPG
jgi:glycerol-3-phosphate dehydrogenase